MKSRKRLLSLVLFAAAAFASSAFGAADGSRVELSVPFAFVVSGRTLPAGTYQLAENGSLLYIRGNHNALIVSSVPTSYSVGAKPSLVFRRQGGLAYLIGVQTSSDARKLPFHPEHALLAGH